MKTNSNPEIKKYFGSVDTIAEDLLVKLLGSIQLPVNIDEVMSKLGVPCTLKDLDDDVSGAIRIEGNKASMIINQAHSDVRQRFTKAHEIGHLIAHMLTKSGESDGFVDRGNPDCSLKTYIEKNRDTNSSIGSDPEEVFANKFAAALLIPKSKLLEYLRNDLYASNIPLLAEIFKVSKTAMEFRLKSIGW